MLSSSEYTSARLGDVLELEYGRALPAEARTGEGFPVFGSSGPVGRHSRSLVDAPGIVVGRKGTVGAVRWSDEPFWPIDTTYYVRARPGVNLRWLYWTLRSLAISRLDSSTGVPGLNRNDAYGIFLRCPPEPEQRRIAEILDTIDEAIRRTERVIAKLQQMKQGLLRDLLTRGVDDHGTLRDPERHPEHFKDSSLGRVPLTWDVTSLNDACDAVVDCPHSTPEYLEHGVLVARTTQVRDGRYDVEGSSRVTEAEYRKRISRLEPMPGDVILTREAPVGEAFTIPVGMRICLGQRVMLLRPSPRRALGEYLVAQIYSGVVRHRIGQLTGGTTNPHLNVGEIKSFQIPLPQVDEQARMVSRLDALDGRLQLETTEATKLRLLKLGMMNDLLSGRVRVPRR